LRYCRSRFFTFLFFMQKLSRTSSCKNNKCCRIFLFSLRFYTNFQSFSKSHLLFKTRFYRQVLELLFLSRIGPCFTKNTLELMKEKQCSPWAWRAARLVEIGPLRWRPWPGMGWGRSRGLATVDSWPQMGGGAPVDGRPTAPREPGRGARCSDGLPVREGARATLVGL
jgi:hypothetical protein